jgi:Peptidase family M1 domain
MPPLLLGVAALLQAAASGPRAPYWQQDVRYEIQASLDEAQGVLAGRQRLAYRNNSPDTLSAISFHLYLNAFRPGSRWADADSAERRRRFNDLKDPDYAFNHVRNVRIDGEPVEPIWPLAPDSTIVRFQLPAPLPPGASTMVDLDWDARPSTVPRRQGRRRRAFDFAQWYPRVVTYDRYGWEEHALYPAGEFYGEFGTFLVELDLPDDQVIGATGVPICGDPGWERVNQIPDRPIQYQRGYYPEAPRYRSVGHDCVGEGDEATGRQPLGEGRKRVVWYAENVHHFAMSLNPEYRYEGGAWGRVAIHVLYQPGDETSWGRGIASGRTAKALEWLDGFFGTFAWPQITNVHRIEGGGTEFPMMIHDGSASQGLIVHELGHNYVMGILANNEWKEGWLDEGFTSFQTTLFFESQRPGANGFLGDESFVTGLDLDGRSEPTSLVSEAYRDFNSYNISIYTRGEVFFHQLRYLVGDAALRRIMRTYYDRWKLKHVDEAAFREVAEEVSGMDLTGFFAQQLHDVVLTDYAVGRVRVRRTAGPAGSGAGGPGGGDGWESRVEVLRKAEGKIPVEVWVIAEQDTAVVRTDGLAGSAWVTVRTRTRPKEILLDPRLGTRDWNMLNNLWRRGWLFPVRKPKQEHYLDTWFGERRARDHETEGWLPTAWYNAAAGITLGIRTRQNYFGRFERNLALVSVGTGWESDRDVKDADFFVRLENPVALHRPGMTQTLEGYNVEGRFGARLALAKVRQFHLGWGPERSVHGSLTWLQPDDFRYLDRGYYEDAGTVELEVGTGVTDRVGRWALGVRTSAAAGLAYNRRGLGTALGRTDVPGTYGRFSLEASARRSAGSHWTVAGRLYGGFTTGDRAVVKQRQVYLAGADPLEQFGNPFLRSSGALLVRPDIYYHQPGGAGLRGFDPRLSTVGAVALNGEVERTLLSRPRGTLFRRVGIALFGDAGHAIRDGIVGRGDKLEFLADAGVGLRAEHRIGETTFTTRVDFPILVSRPELAQDQAPGGEEAGFRWGFSFSPAF